MAIVLIAIGLLFTGVDFMVGSGISYPDFIQPTGLYHGIDIHPRIQQYVTQNILGHNLQVDILPDVIGCLLVLIGAFMFVKHNKKFWFGALLAILAGGCSVALRVIPFYVNGGALILSALSLYFLAFVFEIWMEYIMIYVTVNVSDDMANAVWLVGYRICKNFYFPFDFCRNWLGSPCLRGCCFIVYGILSVSISADP